MTRKSPPSFRCLIRDHRDIQAQETAPARQMGLRARHVMGRRLRCLTCEKAPNRHQCSRGALQNLDQKGSLMSADHPPLARVDLGGWRGRDPGLSAREAEVIALITQGLGNEEIASRTCVSINTVKSYIRAAYRKIGVDSRTRAVLWGVDHGFRPDSMRAQAPDKVH